MGLEEERRRRLPLLNRRRMEGWRGTVASYDDARVAVVTVTVTAIIIR